MRVLIDAHALLWFVWNHANLSQRAREVMADRGTDLLLSAATGWEIAIKVSLRKLQLAEPFQQFMQRAIRDCDLTILPITLEHTVALVDLPWHHRDPFDRLLVAQACVEQIPILSADRGLDGYPITRLW